MIEPAHQRLSIAAQCRLLSISRSSYYYAPVPESEEGRFYPNQGGFNVRDEGVPFSLQPPLPLPYLPCRGCRRGGGVTWPNRQKIFKEICWPRVGILCRGGPRRGVPLRI